MRTLAAIMKNCITTLVIILFAGQAFGQATKPNKLIIDSDLMLKIKNENQTYFPNEIPDASLRGADDIRDTIKADLIVNHDPKLKDEDQIYINCSKAKLSGDTLKITLFHHGFPFVWDYDILIFKGQYQIKTWFTPPLNDHVVKIKPLTTFLKLNSKDFVKNQIIFGQTRFTGKCNGENIDCFSKDILIEGNFKVRVE